MEFERVKRASHHPPLHRLPWPPRAYDGATDFALPRLSSTFNLLPELAKAGYSFTPRQRIEMQMHRWRREPTFGIIENKLLTVTLLRSLHIPSPPVIYGAFATKELGGWPVYRGEDLEAAVRGRREFVLKATRQGLEP